MAASWMMVELTGSSFLAGAGADGGVPADVPARAAGGRAGRHDRPPPPDPRALLACRPAPARCWRVLLLAGWAGPGTLLFFIFVAGCCTALLSPAWNSIARRRRAARGTAAGDHRGGDRLQRGARGRAGAGRLRVRGVGGGWIFALAVLSTLLMTQAIRRWPPAPHPPSRLPAERLWGGMLSALRFARHSQTVLAQLRARPWPTAAAARRCGRCCRSSASASSDSAPPASAC